MSNPLEQLNAAIAPVNQTVESAGSLWESFVNILKMAMFAVPVLLGGGFLVNYMRDQGMEMPDWLSGIVDTVFGGLGSLLSQIPGPIGEWLGGLFARNTNDAIAGATEEQVAGTLNGAPPALSALLTPQPFRQNLRDVARTPEGEIPMTDLLTTKRGLTRMLTTDNGRTALRSIITALRTDFPNGLPSAPAAAAAGETPTASGGMFDINTLGPRVKTALGEILADSAGFSTIWANADSRALLIDGASLASGITFGENNAALATFLGTEPAAARSLMTSFMNNPETALTTLINDPNVSSASLYNLLSSASAGTDSPFAASLQNFRDIAPNLEAFTVMRTNIQEIGQERMDAFAAPGNAITALVTYAAPDAENRLTAANLQGLARAARLSGAEVSPYVLTIMEQHGQPLLDLISNLGTQDFQRFTTLLETAGREIPADATDAAAQQTARTAARGQLLRFIGENPERRAHIMGFLNVVSPSLPADLRASLTEITSLSPTVAVNAGTALEALNLDAATEQSLLAAMETAKNGNYTDLATLLLRDSQGQVNVRQLIRSNPTVLAALANIAGDVPENANYGQRASAAFLTGGGATNISALLTLIDTIDNKTGLQYRNSQGQAIAQDEAQADQRTARVVSFLIRLSSGQATAEELEQRGANDTTLIEDISRRMNDINVVNAMQTFLNTADVSNMTPAQRGLFNTLKDTFFIDSNHDGRMQRREGTFNPLRLLDHSDDGLAPYLADPDHAAIVLRALLGNNGFFGLHGESWATQPGMVADGNLGALRTAGAAVDVERGATVRPTPVEMPGVRGGINGNLPYGT